MNKLKNKTKRELLQGDYSMFSHCLNTYLIKNHDRMAFFVAKRMEQMKKELEEKTFRQRVRRAWKILIGNANEIAE